MPEGGLIETWQRHKRILVLLTLTGTVFLLVCLNLRFIPSINDRLSGKPQYMRWIADMLARSLAAKIGDDFPVIVLRDEKNNCQTISNAGAFDSDNLYYVLLYSETTRSVCFLTCAKPGPDSSQGSLLTLTQEAGRNYGRKFRSPSSVVPVSQVNVSFPDSYLSLLHWRAKIDPSTFGRVGDAKVQRSLAPSLPVSFVNVSIDFAELRTTVARRHSAINAVLTTLILVFLLLTSLASARTWVLYRRFRTHLLFYGAQVAFWPFLREDLTAITQHARETHHQEQERILRENRAAILFKRSKEAIRGQLESMRNALPDEQQRHRIQDSLEEDDIEKMNALVQELLGQVGQKTPEEKLTSLLDTLQDYCNSEEFDHCCAEAFRILAAEGFREARSFVVEVHDQFRARARELERKEGMEVG